eukprot:6195130-Pleurochrysis_carterae.AAC.1
MRSCHVSPRPQTHRLLDRALPTNCASVGAQQPRQAHARLAAPSVLLGHACIRSPDRKHTCVQSLARNTFLLHVSRWLIARTPGKFHGGEENFMDAHLAANAKVCTQVLQLVAADVKHRVARKHRAVEIELQIETSD